MATMRDEKQALHPRGVWLKTHLYLEGGHLHAKTFLAAAGNPRIIEVSVPLKQIAAAVARYHAEELHHGSVSGCVSGDCGCVGGDCSEDDSDFDVSGCVGCAEVGKKKHRRRRGILRLAKLRVMKKTMVKVKKALGRVVKPLLHAAAIVYPPVGAPALLAYEAVDKRLRQVERGANMANAAGSLIEHGKRVKGRVTSKLLAKAQRKGLFEKHGKVKVFNSIERLAKKAVVKKLSKTKASRTVRQEAADLIMAGRKGREELRKTLERAASGSIPDVKKKAIYRLVAAHHRRLRKLGLGVDSSGKTALTVSAKGHATVQGGCIGCAAIITTR